MSEGSKNRAKAGLDAFIPRASAPSSPHRCVSCCVVPLPDALSRGTQPFLDDYDWLRDRCLSSQGVAPLFLMLVLPFRIDGL